MLTKRVMHAFQKLGACAHAPSARQAQVILFLVGVVFLAGGIALDGSCLEARYNDVRLSNSVNIVLTAVEGAFGSLVMVCAGIGPILSSAFGQYRAALALMVVAIGSFILRSFVSTFFNDTTIQA
jgi:hypothetical protein